MVLPEGGGASGAPAPFLTALPSQGGENKRKCRGIAPRFPAFSRTNTQTYN